MEKVIKDGKEVIEWEQVNLTYHADGNVGIGTPPQIKWDASAPLVMGEPVERMRISMTDGVRITPNQEPMGFSFSNATEWARIDKDMNVTHLDMELCAKGPHNAYTALAMAIWNKAIETEREKVAQWMMQRGYATGHGDTIEDLLKELDWQIRESEREACAKACEEITNELSNWPAAYDVVTAETKQDSTAIWQAIGKPFVEAIRARK